MNVKKTISLFMVLVFLSSCAAVKDSRHQDIATMSKTLALGKMINLNSKSSTLEKDLLVRLYEVPIFENDCFIETHGVCQNEYYIAVSTFDEYPEVNFYRLGQIGELVDFEWLDESISDYVEISFMFRKYRMVAVENNPALLNENARFIIKLDIREIIEVNLLK